jgi:hypothetical protein
VTPVRIPQTRTTPRPWESQQGLLRRHQSTSYSTAKPNWLQKITVYRNAPLMSGHIHSPANICRRGGLDPVQDARTGSAGASEDRVLDRIEAARQTRRQEMNGSSPGSARNFKSRLLRMIFPGGINGLPNDSCGAQISPSQTSLDTPPVAILAKRGSLRSDRNLICHYGSVAIMAVTAAN